MEVMLLRGRHIQEIRSMLGKFIPLRSSGRSLDATNPLVSERRIQRNESTTFDALKIIVDFEWRSKGSSLTIGAHVTSYL